MKKNLTSSPQIAAPESGRGAAPHVFAATVEKMLARNTAAGDYRQICFLTLIHESNLPMNQFADMLEGLSPETAGQLSGEIETLEALYDVCTGKEF